MAIENTIVCDSCLQRKNREQSLMFAEVHVRSWNSGGGSPSKTVHLCSTCFENQLPDCIRSGFKLAASTSKTTRG